MKNNPNFVKILMSFAMFVACAVIFLTDVLCKNIIGASLSMSLIVSMCVAIGYFYSKFEKWNDENGVDFKIFGNSKSNEDDE